GPPSGWDRGYSGPWVARRARGFWLFLPAVLSYLPLPTPTPEARVADHPKLSELHPVRVWGLPLAPVTFSQTLDLVDELVAEGKPRYFITANLHYAMLTASDPRLPPVNEAAAFIVADGMPLVWASRWRESQLPERVAGSDLVPALCERAAQRGYRIFFLGGAPGIGEEAAQRM